MGRLTDQYFDKPENYKDKGRQRMYLKDIDCPPVWQEKLKEHIPPSLFYWNDSTGEVGGPGAVDEPIPDGAGRRKSKGIACAGDLMSSLPVDMRADNLMCYIGHEGTYTPAHREMCASLGQNIMVDASEALDENGQPEKPGSSIWFMTETKDRHTVAEFWLSRLGHDIEVENHFAQVAAWQHAPFKVYAVEQRAGDFILIPPLAPHQVWNRGTRTMKVAWNRTTVETLELAMKEALPNARMVCRDEQYKNKAIVYYTLDKYSRLLKSARVQASHSQADVDAIHASKKVRQVQKDFKRLFELYKNILLSESFAPGTRETCEYVPFDSNVTCAYCRGNIFNRFLTCKTCMDMLNTGTDEPYDVCMDCFTMGRSCACQSKYEWVEQFKWKDLVAHYEEWRKQIIDIDGGTTDKTRRTLVQERENYGSKTVAQVCQEQLKKRPWVDVKQPQPEEHEDSEEEIQINDDGTVKKAVKKRSKSWHDNHKTCHVCCNRHPTWMMAVCTMCERGWCYGTLWRAFDLMPQDVMKDPDWECPHCQRVCSTGACRKDKRHQPYEPKGTLLGHDTKKVADIRSVEALVDFSVSNLNWLRESAAAGPTESARLQRKKDEAERAKLNDPILDERYVDGDENEGLVLDGDHRLEIEYSPDNNMIDPALGGGSSTAWRVNDRIQDPSLYTTSHNSERNTALDCIGGDAYLNPDYNLNGGFVSPSAVMYNSFDTSFDRTLNEPLHSQSTFAQTTKNRPRPEDGDHIKLVTSKKRKVAEDNRQLPKIKAGKQYQIVQETKRLEEARKAGRYIQTLAAMRKRKRIVVLKVPKDKLKIFACEASSRDVSITNQPSTQDIMLQSDDAQSKTGTSFSLNANPNKKAAKHSRVRLEDDEDLLFRDRGGPKKWPKPQHEEIVVESYENEEADQDRPSLSQRKDERRSSRLARKDQGEEDLPDDLPLNFNDHVSRPRRKRNTNRRTTLPVQLQARKAPHPQPRARTRSIGLIGLVGSPDAADDSDYTSPTRKRGKTQAVSTKPDASRRVIEFAKAATLEANKRTGFETAGVLADDGSEFEPSLVDEDLMPAKVNFADRPKKPAKSRPFERQRKPAKGGPTDYANKEHNHSASNLPARNSLFSRPGIAGKKIKIVGALDPETIIVSGDRRRSAKRVQQKLVQISDEDNSSSSTDGEIPSNLVSKLKRPATASL
jgi:hypothetical protein